MEITISAVSSSTLVDAIDNTVDNAIVNAIDNIKIHVSLRLFRVACWCG